MTSTTPSMGIPTFTDATVPTMVGTIRTTGDAVHMAGLLLPLGCSGSSVAVFS